MYQLSETNQERLEAAYIANFGERGADGIVDEWLEQMELVSTYRQTPAFRKASLKLQLVAILKTNLLPIEIAGEAARLVGNPDFEQFVEDEQ